MSLTSPADELPTLPFTAIRPPAPLPQPRTAPPLPKVLPPLPRSLGKATLVIGIPIASFEERELKQILAWAETRMSVMIIERPLRERASEWLTTVPRRAAERVLARARLALEWIASRAREGRRLLGPAPVARTTGAPRAQHAAPRHRPAIRPVKRTVP